ncbi:MAG TPA: hypothetical protein VFH29_06130 [Anaerolineales bacterium]|nr:hypothetical protein [Anaerolineales bacterium]
MKRLAWLLLIVIFAFSTVAFAAPAPPSDLTPAPNQQCHNIRLVRVCSWVEAGVVKPGSSVTIYGSYKSKGVGVPGQIMRVVWSARVTQTCIGVTDSTGVASCTTYVPSYLSSGRTVTVKVWVDKYKINTHFRIKVGNRGSDSED